MTNKHETRDGIEGVNTTPISPDENGYYHVVLGKLNQYSNIQGGFFIFNQDSFDAFKNRVETGTVFINVSGSIPQRQGRSLHDYMSKFRTVSLDDVGAVIKDVEAVPEQDKTVSIKATIKPCGKKADVVQYLLDDGANTHRIAFGMRALAIKTLSDDGTFKLDIDRIFSFDLVD